jgi:hypothetical protein
VVEVSDAAYMDAVAKGDMKTAQRLVDAAAKKAGYTVGPVYHGKITDFNTFKVPEKGERAIFFSDSIDESNRFPLLKGRRPLEPVSAYLSGNLKRLQYPKDSEGSFLYDPDVMVKLLETARREGFDGVEIDGIQNFEGGPMSTTFAVFKPSQIKSADPVTYDDNGNVIPLSQRFSSQSEDIRNPKRKIKRGLRKNPVVFPADDITFAAASPTAANLAIAAGKTLWDTPAFKKWFGDSKVRDLAKRPMVVYHGTCSAEFTEFDPTKTQEVGFHFGTPAQAKDFLKGCGSSRGKTPGIYPVYLSIQNPIFTPDVYSEDPVYLIEWLEKTNHIHEWFPDESDSYYRSMNRLRDQMASIKSDSTLTGAEQYKILKPLRKATSGLLRKVIMRKGYDGIRYKNENEGRTDDPTNIAWIAFSPAQVKSATENIRTFDRRDPDIRNPRRSMIRTKLSRILEPGDRVLDYDRAQGEDLYRLWDMVHTDKPLTKEALVEIEGMLDDDGVLVIQSGEEPSGLKDHFRRATRYQGMLLVQGPMNPEEARINTEKLRRDLE